MKKRKIICIIMGGGRGTRLYPLTKERCKPAVPLGGKYRLVDIPISNCLNSGLNKIYILSQFNTASLHHHIQETYKFDSFGGGCVDILSAEQTDSSDSWYQGTADAVRQNMHHFRGVREDDLYLILSGDQLYRMNFADMVREHDESGAAVTIAAKPLALTGAKELGLMRIDESFEVKEFVEKPTDPEVIKGLVVGENVRQRMRNPEAQDYCLASLGIYVFRAKTLVNALENNNVTDFGGGIIPELLGREKVHSYVFDGYWEDIGTIKAFFNTNLSLTDKSPSFNFFDSEAKIYTRARLLPATKLNSCKVDHAVIGDGCTITEGFITRSLLGLRSVIRSGTVLENVVMLGADFYETPEDLKENLEIGRPALGVGEGCNIKHAILDKNVRIGNNVILDPAGLPDDSYHAGNIIIRDGIMVVCKNTKVPNGFVLKA